MRTALFILISLLVVGPAWAQAPTDDGADAPTELSPKDKARAIAEKARSNAREAADDIEAAARKAGAEVREAADGAEAAAEEAGRAVKAAAENAGEKVREAGAEVKAFGEKAGDTLDEAVEEIGRAAHNAKEKGSEATGIESGADLLDEVGEAASKTGAAAVRAARTVRAESMSIWRRAAQAVEDAIDDVGGPE